MATIRKRNNKYQVQVRIKGLSSSATLISLDNARRWARQKELELESKLKLGELYRPKNFFVGDINETVLSDHYPLLLEI